MSQLQLSDTTMFCSSIVGVYGTLYIVSSAIGPPAYVCAHCSLPLLGSQGISALEEPSSVLHIFQDCDGVPVVVVLRAHSKHPSGTGYLQGHTGDRP